MVGDGEYGRRTHARTGKEDYFVQYCYKCTFLLVEANIMSSQQEKMDINRVGFGNKLWMLKNI